MSGKNLWQSLKRYARGQGGQSAPEDDPEGNDPYDKADFPGTEEAGESADVASAEDKARESLVRTGAMVLMNFDYYDITREVVFHADGIEQLEVAKPADQLVADFWAHLTALRAYSEIAGRMIDELLTIGDDDESWEKFKQMQEAKIVLLFENVFASPSKVYKARQKKTTQESLKHEFMTQVKRVYLLENLFRKSESFNIVFENDFILEFSKNYRAGQKTVALSEQILKFRKAYFKELNSIAEQAGKLRIGKYSGKDIPAIKAGLYANAQEASASIGHDAFVYLVETFWNGTFYRSKPTFSGSVKATLYSHTKKSMISEWRVIQKIPDRVEMPLTVSNLEPEWYDRKIIGVQDYAKAHGKMLSLWFDALTERARTVISADAFLQYAYSVSPRDKGTEVENEFYKLLKQQDVVTADHNTYQGRVRDGGYLAARLFNEYLFTRETGLAFIGERQLRESKYREAVRSGTRIFVDFPANHRDRAGKVLSLTDEACINFILETLQDSHWQFSILDA